MVEGTLGGLSYGRVLATIGGVIVVGAGGGLIKPMQQRWERYLTRAEEEAPRVKEQAQNAPSVRDQAQQAKSRYDLAEGGPTEQLQPGPGDLPGGAHRTY